MEQITMVPLEQLHPHEQNPRIDAAQVEDLAESIREHGIEVPLVVVPPYDDTEGGWVVIAGHRRLTAAHAVGLTEVPVLVRADLMSKQEQLAFMASENVHRDQLTPMEESRLVQDMLELGMTQAQVAKQTALGKQRVRDRVKLSKLAEDTGEKVHRGQVSIDDALVIAEYSDDPQIAQELEAHAGTYHFDFITSRAKARREKQQRTDAAMKEAKKRGIRIAGEAADFVGLAELIEIGFTTPTLEDAAAREVDGEEWGALVASEHSSCPGHAARVIQYGSDAGYLETGCDQVAEQHADATSPTAEPEPASPWDDITAEDFDAARIHREQHLAKQLPAMNPESTAVELATEQLLGQCWRDYGDSPDAVALIEALTGVEGKSRVRRKLATWPLSVLVLLNTQWWELAAHHRYMGEGRQGSSYWGEKSKLRRLLEDTGYSWTEPEQRAILLATGKAHDATDEADGAALAEGGEAA
ncbi:ParB/RepB/Spo0J family partition protein [Brachybacterium massiliense]|uniref:ParB/RepB/Spo0J family partition protein n=1 Tax=Brachybacterium massiliense TaxID=1755098 RepID=UPI000B3BCB75|nr:ParB/RepB/Spo0J family partition protein [Brachybacterium massiliense]